MISQCQVTAEFMLRCDKGLTIITYRHLRVGKVGGEYGYWLLEGNECSAAGGFPSNPILSGSVPTIFDQYDPSK